MIAVFEEILEQCEAKMQGDGQYVGHCPAHPDKTPSLSIKMIDEKILLHCHAGCLLGEVLSALNLTERDLFLHSQEQFGSGERFQELKETARYLYEQPDGSGQFVVLRYEAFDKAGKKTKTFRQQTTNINRPNATALDLDFVTLG